MTGDGGEKGARPYLESLGTAGILLGGEGAPSVLGGAVMLEALPAVAGGPAGQLLLLDDAPNAVEPLAAFLARNRWVAYLPARLAEALRDRPPLRGRISTIAPGLSFLVAGAEMDVLPRGPETAGFTVLLDWHGVLLLYPAAPPTTRTAAEWWKTFHLCRFLLPFPGQAAIMEWMNRAPLDEADAQRVASAAAAAQLYVETGEARWRAWPLAPGQRLWVVDGGLSPQEEK